MSQNKTREDDGEAGGDTSVSLGHEDDTWSKGIIGKNGSVGFVLENA